MPYLASLQPNVFPLSLVALTIGRDRTKRCARRQTVLYSTVSAEDGIRREAHDIDAALEYAAALADDETIEISR